MAKKTKNADRKSVRDRFRALRTLPPFFRLIWQTNPRLFAVSVVLRVIRAAIPVTMLYLGKLIIDEVVRLAETDGSGDLTQIFIYIGLEFGLAIVSDAINRSTVLLDSLLGDRFANETSARLMAHAGQLDLAQFEDADFYDKLERARAADQPAHHADVAGAQPVSEPDHHWFPSGRPRCL